MPSAESAPTTSESGAGEPAFAFQPFSRSPRRLELRSAVRGAQGGPSLSSAGQPRRNPPR